MSPGADAINPEAWASLDFLPEDWLRSLVTHTLRQSHPGNAALEAADQSWHEVRRHLTVRNLLVLGELGKVLGKLQEGGRKVLVLKGAALTEEVYPHPGLRFFGDIDLLIKEADLPRIVAALRQLGFAPLSPPFGPGSAVFQTSLHYLKQTAVPIAIEPHWALGRVHPYAGRVNMEALWARAAPVKIAGVDTLTLCPEDFLVHLCLHLVQHSQGGWLVSACDIAALIRRRQDQLDWQGFVQRVREYGLCLPVRFSLKKVGNLFRPPIPPEVLEELDLYRPGRLETLVFSLLVNPSRKAGPVAQLLSTPGLRSRLRFLRGILFPTKAYMRARYHIQAPGRLPYFYVRRLKEALTQGLGALVVLIQAHLAKPG